MKIPKLQTKTVKGSSLDGLCQNVRTYAHNNETETSTRNNPNTTGISCNTVTFKMKPVMGGIPAKFNNKIGNDPPRKTGPIIIM